MSRLIAALVLAGLSSVASAADKPLPVTVTNPVVPVEVSNADPIPVTTVDGEPPVPYMVSDLTIAFTNGRNGRVTYDVPEGKRLIIETVAVGAWIPIGTSVAMLLRTRLDNSSHWTPLALESLGVTPEFNANIPKQTFAGTHPVRIPVDGDSSTDEIQLDVIRSSAVGENTTNNFASVSISGYLVDR